MNVLLLTSHAIAEHDDLEMFTRMGVDCYSIGGAYDEVPFEGKRPALPGVKRFPELEAATQQSREQHAAELGDPGPYIDWGKARLHRKVIDWADVIIVHHFPEQWIGGQWGAIRDKRVIWRTCGQSDVRLEESMSWFRKQGMEIVRYSPKEREAFTKWGAFAGEDAMIRFGKDPQEWSGWTGTLPYVGNITQHMKQRGDACGYPFWEAATAGLPVKPAGPGSEELRGGIGSLPYDQMLQYLRDIRVYLYTGTRPASYTLGLIEAMMTGTPVLTMGPDSFQPRDLYEAHELSALSAVDVPDAQRVLSQLLRDPDVAADISTSQRRWAVEYFGLEGVTRQWADYLGFAS